MLSRFWSWGNLLKGLALLVLIALVAWRMIRLREHILTTLGTPEAIAAWQEWRGDADKPGPVERRKPKSSEPPALVLLRDYFGVCLSAAIFFSSLLFLVSLFLLGGAFGGRGNPPAGKLDSSNIRN